MPNGSDAAPQIAILLATYNGGRYIRQQLQSLWQQSRQDFAILVRDDGSSDDTLAIIEDESRQHPGRIQRVSDTLGRLGPARSFRALMQHANSRWIAFCDQDDQWLPDKLQRQVDALQAIADETGDSTPALCCSDAIVVDAELRTLCPSYFGHHNFRVADGRDLALSRLLFRNVAVGATTMVNAAMVQRCRAMPDEAIMHDWWCALMAKCCGRLTVIPDGLIRYRQHDRNAIGSVSRPVPRSLVELRDYLKLARQNAHRSIEQATALHLALLNDATSPPNPGALEILGRFSSFQDGSRIQRLGVVIRTRAFKPGLALILMHLFTCVTA